MLTIIDFPSILLFDFQNYLNSFILYSLIELLLENSLLFKTSTLFATNANSNKGLTQGAGGICFHLCIKDPVILTSSPGLQVSTNVFYKITQIDLGIKPGFKVLKSSYNFIS